MHAGGEAEKLFDVSLSRRLRAACHGGERRLFISFTYKSLRNGDDETQSAAK